MYCDGCSRYRRVLPLSSSKTAVRVCDACALAIDNGEDDADDNDPDTGVAITPLAMHARSASATPATMRQLSGGRLSGPHMRSHSGIVRRPVIAVNTLGLQHKKLKDVPAGMIAELKRLRLKKLKLLRCRSWWLRDITAVYARRYLLRLTALEVRVMSALVWWSRVSSRLRVVVFPGERGSTWALM